MPEGFVTDIDDKIFRDVLDLAAKQKNGDKTPDGKLSRAFENYLEQLVRYATGEDHIWDKPDALLARAESAWANNAVRKPGDNNISLQIVNNDSGRRLVLDISTDDKPFLVDSVSAALADATKPVSFFSNAVVDVLRDEKGKRIPDGEGAALRESVIHAEMDPPVRDEDIDALHRELENVLADVSNAVSDWEPMRTRLAACITQLEKSRIPGLRSEDQKEAIQFLKWLWDNRFAFLGVRRFNYANKDGDIKFEHDHAHDLGILRDPNRRILNSTFQSNGELSPAVASFLTGDEPIIIAKSNTKSLIHRRVYMDYVGVKMFSHDGAVIGEERFIGLFTADAYNRPARDIPLIRSKVDAVLDETSFTPGGHNEKALINILETFPRDELFQMDVETLRETSLGILRLYKRPRVKLFLNRDRFDRYISALAFIPRDHFNSDLREEVGDLLCETFNGRLLSFSPFFGDAALVRVHFIIGIDRDAPEGPGLPALTAQLRNICRDWSDDLLDAMRKQNEGAAPVGLFSKYERAFSEGYKERVSLPETLADIGELEKMTSGASRLRAYRLEGDSDDTVRIKIYITGEPLPLSRLIPTIENLGLDVNQESGYRVSPEGEDSYWLHDFYTRQSKGKSVRLDEVKEDFEETILAVLRGDTEDDGFNGLVLTAGINWREAWVLRAAARHHMQSGFQYSQSYVEEALANNPEIVRDLIAAFHARFNPEGPKDSDERIADVKTVYDRLNESLAGVDSLDEDRIIRRFMEFFSATTRTNYYQTDSNGAPKAYISFKIDSHAISEMPEPRPYREIFVSGPRVDGVHLRFGPIARGGLRWSDRREDFRTEVLGLVKAQRVKNAVIVPNGSKGGFYPKQLPVGGDRNEIFEEGRESYKVFIRGLLDLTDNIVHGKTVTPSKIVRWDDPDPYLVVAADKGTATFSDTANAISEEYGFWLGDAFASGGSAGYDHKVMGITARGGWEAVKRHFREMGKDIQTEPFTVAGVGDMSGDVFGNGMLLSEQIKLVAAFDHRDIFIDPNPDPAKSFKERKRLFEAPRTSWQDYDKKLISKGGGVFPRSAKTIQLTDEIREALAIDDEKLAPHDLIRAILKAPVELLWFGGIGTYIKSRAEENLRVGDRANDPVRIDASEAGAKVIGEGANLGITQLARIEFARKGGRINTDAIDNSAGVDSSDHEVNIKILLANAIESGDLKKDDRNDLLATMTDDVARHVLVHNYEQTRALTQLEARASKDLDLHARLMSTLERAGRLDRAIEYLPDSEQIAQLRQQGRGLSRPELSVLIAYAKLWLFDELVDCETPDDHLLEKELFAYFPEALHQFNNSIVSHRLRREIIATRLANEIIDTCGLNFSQRVAETGSLKFGDAALAYEAVRRIFNLVEFSEQVDALDNKAPSDLQTDLYLAASDMLREQVFHLANNEQAFNALTTNGLKSVIARFQASVAEFKKALPQLLPQSAADALAKREAQWIERGAPKEIAAEAATIPIFENAFDIVDTARETGWSNPGVGGLFFAIGRQLDIETMRQRARHDPPGDHFDRIAIRQLVSDLSARQRLLTLNVIKFVGSEPKGAPTSWVESAMSDWRRENKVAFSQFAGEVSDLDLQGPVSVGKYSLFIRKLDQLAAATQ